MSLIEPASSFLPSVLVGFTYFIVLYRVSVGIIAGCYENVNVLIFIHLLEGELALLNAVR